jgi:hypothetical protein
MVVTFAEAQEWLRQRGVETRRMDWGLVGQWRDGERSYEIGLGGASDGGADMSVRFGAGHPTWWIHAQSIDRLLKMMVEAQNDVDAGSAATWLDALKAKDPIRWLDPEP